MVNNKSLRFKCIHCGNCCKDQNTFINLTFHDILLIKKGLGLTLEETIQMIGFYLFEKGFNEKELKRMVISPLETEKGLAFLGLLKNQDGSCFFYNIKEKRCSIYPLRPIFCKTFPFTFKKINNLELEIFYTEKAKDYCLGIGKDAPEIDSKEWFILGNNVLNNIKENQIFITNWNRLVNKGKISPTVKNLILSILNIASDN
ncbi:MAG: YkgJ family cysteine cluster protein [Candidatus Hodarchaeota archaeon]